MRLDKLLETMDDDRGGEGVLEAIVTLFGIYAYVSILKNFFQLSLMIPFFRLPEKINGKFHNMPNSTLKHKLMWDVGNIFIQFVM